MTPPAPMVYGPLTRTDFVRYQGASGDMNPVHHDEGFARAAGFEAPLAVGMFTAGLMTTWATDWLGPRNVRRVKMRWKKPLFPGAVLTIGGVVASERDGRVDLALTVRDEHGDVAVEGEMTFVVAR